MRKLMPLIAAIIGGILWYPVVQFLQHNFGEHNFAGRVMQSPVNLFSLAMFSAVGVKLISFSWRGWCESRWERLSLLPEGDSFRSYAEVEPFSKLLAAQGHRRKLRPLRLLRACFESVRSKWSAAAANDALTTEYALMRADADAQYSSVVHLVSVIPSIGCIGTLLGLGQSLGEIRHSLDAALAQLHVAFDTTLVAIVLSIAALLSLNLVRTFEESVLLNAFNKVQHEFVLRIRED